LWENEKISTIPLLGNWFINENSEDLVMKHAKTELMFIRQLSKNKRLEKSLFMLG